MRLPAVKGATCGGGPDGKAASQMEVWSLEMSGTPAFDLRDQDGRQDRGNGGDSPTMTRT
jgi:hypothetical protein